MILSKIAYVFDNDGTLYTCPPDFEKLITEKIIQYLSKLCSTSVQEILELRKKLFRKYKIRHTLSVFFMEGIVTDVEEFMRESYLAVDPHSHGICVNPSLRNVLKNIHADLFVHTNNPSAFARKIMDCLGIRDLFAEIYGMFENDCKQKPEKDAFNNLSIRLSGYKEKWYADNESPNIITVSQLGFRTIAVAEASKDESLNADKKISTILELNSV